MAVAIARSSSITNTRIRVFYHKREFQTRLSGLPAKNALIFANVVVRMQRRASLLLKAM